MAAAEACETTQQRVIDRNGGELPHGLRPGTLSTYSAEWQRYVALAQRLGFDPDVPGRDVPWNPYLLWRFMQWRAESCKPTTVFAAVSALAHFGHQCRFLLPTKKEDGHAMFHRDIAKMKKEISLYHSSKMGHAGATYAVDHSTPLGCASVALIFSAFAVYNERSFLRLSRCDRHHLWAVVAQHARGMRFGHFIYRTYTLRSFARNASGDYSLATDWHRYPGRRRYVLRFARSPRWDCLRYVVRRPDSPETTVLTAALVFD